MRAPPAVNEMLGAGLLGYATLCPTQILLRLDAQTIARAGRPAVIVSHPSSTVRGRGLGDMNSQLGMVGGSMVGMSVDRGALNRLCARCVFIARAQ